MNEDLARSFRRWFNDGPDDSTLDRIYQSCSSAIQARGTSWPVAIVSLLIVFLSCGITWRLGLPHTSIYGHDIFTLLDGSWRVSQGQIPHLDFYSAFGPIFYFMQAAGLLLAHYHVEGLVYGTVVAGLVLGVWGIAIIRARLNAVASLFAVAFLILFWLAPFPLGDPYYLPSFAMQYNRLGYTILFLVVVELFGEIREEPSRFDWGGVSTGIALGCLLFMKANFFAVGAVITAGAYVLRVRTIRHAAFVIAGWLIVFCVIASYLHWDLLAFWNDLRIAAGARQTRFHEIKDSIRTAIRNVTAIVAILGLAGLALFQRKGARLAVLPCLKQPLFIALLLLAADFVLSLSNQQRFGFPLTIAAIILFVDQLCRTEVAPSAPQWSAARPALLLVMAVMVLPFIMDTVNAWAIQITVRQNTALATAARVNAAPLVNLVFDDHTDPVWGQSEANGHILTSHINDGLQLIREHSGPEDRIACLCYDNPFPYALLRPPMEGGAAFYDYGTNFTERFAPSAERILGNADVVVYPKAEIEAPTTGTLLKICRTILSERYHTIAESRDWILLKKN
ncbi:MAG TPA: hypothetical protein VF023_06985 [Bryobacteraceae bacterium]